MGQGHQPIRDQLEETLRQQILEGRFADGKLPSVRTLAREHRLSKSTVANAIAKLKQQQLLSTTHKQGVYVLNATNAPLVKKRTRRIGVFAHGETDVLRERIYFDAFSGMQTVATERGYAVMYMGTRTRADSNFAQMPVGMGDIDGLVYLVSSQPSDAFLRGIIKRNLPVVLFDNQAPEFQLDSVLVDNVDGAKKVVRHLVDLGHRRIAFLNSMKGQSAVERLGAYQSVLDEAGIPFDPLLVKSTRAMVGDARVAMSELLPLKPTAVFGFSDFHALGAILAAEAAGLRAPRDLSVAGFGNEAQAFGKNLTTVEVNMLDMGALAVELLMKRIDGQSEPGQIHRVKSRLIVGETTGTAGARGQGSGVRGQLERFAPKEIKAFAGCVVADP